MPVWRVAFQVRPTLGWILGSRYRQARMGRPPCACGACAGLNVLMQLLFQGLPGGLPSPRPPTPGSLTGRRESMFTWLATVVLYSNVSKQAAESLVGCDTLYALLPSPRGVCTSAGPGGDRCQRMILRCPRQA